MRMLRNPEIRRMLLISVPLCVGVTCIVAHRDRQAGKLTALLCVVLLGLYLFSAWRRYRSMAKLAADIDAVLHGRQDIHFAHYTEGEISLLRSELNKLTVRLTEQTDQLQREKVQLAESMADISHQMRTPLTAVNLLLAGLSDTSPADEGYQRKIFALRRQVIRMDWLVNALLKLAKLDAGTVRFQRERVVLSDLVARAAEPLSILMEVKGQTLRINASGAAVCDPAWTAEALSNILKNCTEHMDSGEIFVTAEENAVCACICVRDTGSGIDPNDLPHLFERYYKGSGASEESVGIGLALSRSILAAQNGTLTASNYAGGAEFKMKLYKSVV